MLPKLLIGSAILGGLTIGQAKATVTYSFFDAIHRSTVDLDFTVSAPLSPANSTEPLLSTGSFLASEFAGGFATYLQGPRLSARYRCRRGGFLLGGHLNQLPPRQRSERRARQRQFPGVRERRPGSSV